MSAPRLLITANSPGEMAGWVRPILREWREQGLGPVDLLLLPCTFATGQEERVARSLGVDRVYKGEEFWKLLWHGGREYQSGNLLHLGGDLMYSAFLSWRWGLRSWSYLWARPWWNSAFHGFFTKDDWGIRWLRKRKVPASEIHLTGDLVLDAVRQHVPQPVESKEPQISYLPGSREAELAGLSSFFLEVHRQIQKEHPEHRGILHLSPYLPPSKVQSLLEQEPYPEVGGLRGRVEGDELVADGVRLTLATEEHYQQLSRSELALSIPGTKTAEAGYLRTPLVTIVPLNKPEHLPSIGLLGLLDFLPGGRAIKGQLILRHKNKIGLLAHPNILAGRKLLPEYVEVVQAEVLGSRLSRILRDKEKLRSVSTSLRSLYSWEPQPSRSLIEIISGADLKSSV